MKNYLEYVCEEAKMVGKIFVLDSGEGRDYIDEKTGWWVEDLSGWLIDTDLIDKFNEAKKQKKEYDIFSNEYIFAIWKIDEEKNVKVEFRKYD